VQRRALLAALAAHDPFDEAEARALETIQSFVATHPDCFRRELTVGHVTGSAWVVDRERSHVLLTHHRKLGLWLQLGGHCDGDSDVARVALREAAEESGLERIERLEDGIFDVDVHRIPARKTEPEHFHYDVRYLFEADRNAPVRASDESYDVAWIALDRVSDVATDASVLRMVRKSLATTHRAPVG
jgi:8-oxo-dGTP pyrophosphatase MutT (NUDIX family)